MNCAFCTIWFLNNRDYLIIYTINLSLIAIIVNRFIDFFNLRRNDSSKSETFTVLAAKKPSVRIPFRFPRKAFSTLLFFYFSIINRSISIICFFNTSLSISGFAHFLLSRSIQKQTLMSFTISAFSFVTRVRGSPINGARIFMHRS